MAGINGFAGFISDFIRGTTRDFSIKLSRDGVPIDITDCKFYITFSRDITHLTEPELEIVIDSPTDPINGSTVGKITDDETWLFSVGFLFYSVRFVNAIGDTYVIDMGKIKVIEAISNRKE